MNEPNPEKPRGRRSPGNFVVGFVALVVLVGAGSVIWGAIGEDVKQAIAQARLAVAAKPLAQVAAAPRPPVAAAPVPIEEDESAYWSDVSIYKARPGRPIPIVVLQRGKQPETAENYSIYLGLLARDMVRQGLLISAREELGALTRDVPIGDHAPAGEPDVRFRIGSQFLREYELPPGETPHGRITIVEGQGETRKVVWATRVDYKLPIAPDYSQLAGEVEGFSRKEFRRALEGLGLKRTEPAPARQPEAPLPEKVEASLKQPVETEQFAAIRALHSEIRRGGESRTLLVALARAYAHLGSLSEGQWTSDSNAFQARSLLYGRRALSLDENNPEALSGLAYAEAVVGLNRPASQHFFEADEAGMVGPDPDWIRMIRAFLLSDCKTLATIDSEKPGDPWPAYFRFLSISRSSSIFDGLDRVNRHEIVEAGRHLLTRVPDCYRVHDGLAAIGGVSNLHRATTEGQALYAGAVLRRISTLQGLPARVAGLVDDGGHPDEVSLRRAFDESAGEDEGDVTWGVLARQLREIRFTQVCRRLYFLTDWLNVSPAEFAEQVTPYVADHPSRSYVALFAGVDAEAIKGIRAIDLDDMPYRANSMFKHLQGIDTAWAAQAGLMAWSRNEHGTVPGMVERIAAIRGIGLSSAALQLRQLDPYSPLGRGAWIYVDESLSDKEATEWRKDHGGDDTYVLATLGIKLEGKNKLDEAQELLEAALKASPDLWIFDGLVNIYLKTGRADRWIAAVEEFVKNEDMALDHSKALMGIAKFLMAKGEYEKARSFAERAAASWSGDSMLMAAKCAEAMQDWDGAERWIRRISERYSNDWLSWAYWCKRTGHGDAKAAAALVEAQLAAGRVPRPDEELHVAIIQILDGKPEKARERLVPRFAATNDTTDGAILALACELAGDKAGRDDALKAIGDNPSPSSPRTAKVMGRLGVWLAKGDPNELDMEALKAEIEELTASKWPSTCAILAPFLERNGKQEAALEYFNLANADPCYAWFRLIAQDGLRARGVDPGIFPW
ncbi:tetratricopeptide repeat protein [Isosphaeraceae bacterium EP7]